MRLHIGGEVRKEGWTVLNAVRGPHVDIVGDCRLMKEFADASVDEIYASHVLEHISHAADGPLALKQWHRVLKPGGRLRISVPDLATLSRLFLRPNLPSKGRFLVMAMIYGGHRDPFDVHLAGYDYGMLAEYLTTAGFTDCEQVDSFGEFQDSSELMFAGARISLNVIATKPAG